MARGKSLSEATGAEEIPAVLPIRFVADYNHVEPMVTTAYKAGMVVDDPAPDLRKAALAKKVAVEHGE